jgi:2-oxoglutarate ferredoxin oxidoreductase subunit gamma
MTPEESVRWMMEEMTPVFPLRVFRDEIGARLPRHPAPLTISADRVRAAVHLQEGCLAGATPLAPSIADPSCIPTGRLETEIRLKAAGFGGQGILYLGETLATAGMREGDQVSWLPSYGPEMRGGTAHCNVTLSSQPIGSPLVERATHLVAMNRPSLERFLPEVARGGAVLYDSSLIETAPLRKDVTAIPVAATKVADRLGSARVANMVMLGALLAQTSHPGLQTVLDLLAEAGGKPELAKLNQMAVSAGIELASPDGLRDICGPRP